MEKEQKSIVEERCENELLKNKDYTDVQKRMVDALKKHDIEAYSELSIELQIIVQISCYKLGAKDTLNLLR